MAEVENLTPSTTKEWLMHINSRLDIVVSNQENQCKKQEELSTKIDGVVTSQSTQDVRIENLEKRVNSWSFINSLGVVIAGILAAIGLKSS
jgi:hypothetical protein